MEKPPITRQDGSFLAEPLLASGACGPFARSGLLLRHQITPKFSHQTTRAVGLPSRADTKAVIAPW